MKVIPTFSVAFEKDTLRSENEDDIVRIRTVWLLGGARADELVGFVNGLEHFPAVGVFVRMVLLGQPEVRLSGRIGDVIN